MAVEQTHMRNTIFISRLAILLAGATCIQAASLFYVATSSTSGAPSTGDNASATYNTSTGASFQTSIPQAGGTATATGTSNVTGLTSSFDQTSATGFGVLTPFPALDASSYTAADLSAGSVKSLVSGNEGVSANGAVAFGSGSAVAEIFDTLTFHVAGATNSTVTDIVINTSLDGSAGLNGKDGGIDVVYTLLIPNGDVQFNYNTSNNPAVAVNQFGWVSETVASATPSSFIFQGVTSGQGASFVINLDLKLNVFCQGADCDYSHTGLIDLSLPAGVTYTSASGVFLSSSVPEPASWAMTIGGIMLLACLAVKRRNSATEPRS